MSSESSGAPVGKTALVTTSYAPDFTQFLELRESVARHVPASVPHFVVVPPDDLDQFSEVDNITVIDQSTLIPRRYLKAPGKNWRFNVRRPWWPVRGWVLQQALKLAITARLNHEQIVIVDSDVAFVRDLDPDATLPTVRRPDEVTEALPRHLIWHGVARELLSLPADPLLPQPDWVSSITTWQPQQVRDMLARLEATTNRSWFDIVAEQRHVSEFTLYGVHVELVASEPPPTISRWCCEHWEEVPLTDETGMKLAESVAPTDVAVMVSAKSGTPASVRANVIERSRQTAAAQ
jgi:hypothetical protein